MYQYKSSQLMLAARNNHQRFLRTLVDDYHADVTVVDVDNSTVLHWLACNGRTELLRYALTFPISVNHQDCRGQVLCATFRIQKIHFADNCGI